MRRVLVYAPKSLGNSGNDVQVWRGDGSPDEPTDEKHET
jgi:hypothetical protein